MTWTCNFLCACGCGKKLALEPDKDDVVILSLHVNDAIRLHKSTAIRLARTIIIHFTEVDPCTEDPHYEKPQ